MLGTPRSGPAQAAREAVMATLGDRFVGAGATALDVPHLFLGETLLDLYGEDLRARAFLFPDAERDNELCLRPDFTVPVALAHGASGWDRRAFYSYQGPVFRRQPQGMGRPVEYLQAGIERFGDDDPITAEVAVFSLLRDALADLGITAPVITIGDLSIPFAVLDGLAMSAHRRDALRHHFWRPDRFHALVERATRGGDLAVQAQRLTGADDRLAAAISAGEVIGLRSPDDVLDRLNRLRQDQAEPPMPMEHAELLNAVLDVKGPPLRALENLRKLTRTLDISVALARFEARLEALSKAGVDVDAIEFDAAFGRNLEYYDGFVFEMCASARGGHPPLAGGGRYDTMTTRLGAASPIPAIGGIIRPEAVLEVLG